MQPGEISLEGEALRLVVFGEAKVGKTTLAMTFPRPLVIDLDGGLISVTYAAGGSVSGARYEPKGHHDTEELIKWIRNHLDDHDTIIVDDLDGLLDMLIMELTDEHAKAEKHGSRPLLMSNIPQQVEYLANQRQLKMFLHALRQTKRHIVIIAGVRTDDMRRNPNVSPGAQKIVSKWASVIGEMVAGVEDPKLGSGQHRVLFTAPSPTRTAGSRFAELEPYVVNPTFEKLWGPIQDKMPKIND